MHFSPFHLNLAAGMEDSIIWTLAPEWNMTAGRRKQGSSQTLGEPVLGLFDFKLQPTDWKAGFFNGGVAASPLLWG